jgi:hypothetical protein
VKRSRSMACSGAGGGGVLREKWLRSRAKRSSGVKGEAVEATACSRGEAVEGVLRRRRRAPGVGGVEDIKRMSGENLLSVEWVAWAPDIYIGRATFIEVRRSFFQARYTLFLDERCTFSEA